MLCGFDDLSVVSDWKEGEEVVVYVKDVVFGEC